MAPLSFELAVSVKAPAKGCHFSPSSFFFDVLWSSKCISYDVAGCVPTVFFGARLLIFSVSLESFAVKQCVCQVSGLGGLCLVC